jgi:hypothetical protein
MQQPILDLPRTLEEFRIWHERQPEVWEFIDGVPTLMAPGSMAHTVLKSRMGGLLAAALAGAGCECSWLVPSSRSRGHRSSRTSS